MIHENTNISDHEMSAAFREKARDLIRKSYMAVIISITVIFMMMPAIAFADDTAQTYGLWVGGVQVTSENCDNILDATDEKTGLPTASYDPQTGTLELHDPEITGTYTFMAIKGAIVSTIPLTIVGTARIETTVGDALYVTDSDDTTNGNAPLTFDNGDGFETDLEFIGNTDGISAYGNDITIKGGKVSCSGIYGLYRKYEGGLNIEGGELICKGSYYGIYLFHDNLNITGGKLTAECTGNISEEDRYPLFMCKNYGSIIMDDAPCGTITEPTNGQVVTDPDVGRWIVNPDNTKAAKVVINGDHISGEPTVSAHATADSPGKIVKKCVLCDETTYEDDLYMVATDEGTVNGKVSADVKEAVAGDTVQLNAEPEQYFRLKEWNVTDKSGQKVDVDKDDKFTMPAANVNVSAEFEYIPVTTLRWKGSPQTFWLNEGDIDNKKLAVSVNPSDACPDLVWTSSNEDVATIATDGTITAIKEGTTTITVTSAIDSTKSLSAKLTVRHVHDPSYMAASKPSCTGEGNIEYWICNQGDYACGKLFADAECTQEIAIEDTVIEPAGHEFETADYTWEEDYSAVEAKGKCTKCGEVAKETVAATVKVNKGATCQERGTTIYTAEFKSKGLKTQTREVPNEEYGDHDYGELIAKVEADCTKTGMEAHYECSACHGYFDSEKNETTEEALTIAALGHDLESHDAQAATCTEKGWKAYQTCSRCDYTTYDEIPALGHKWGDWTKKDDEHHQRVCGIDETHVDIAAHSWDNGTVTTEPTEKEDGVRTFTCTDCGATKTELIPAKGSEPKPQPAPGSDPNQKGSDGTAVGPGASAAAAEKAITNMKSDTDPKGAVFGKLKLKSPKQTATSIRLTWTKVSKAKKYVIYGNKCGKGNKPKRLASVASGSTKTLKKVAGKKIRKGTYYKFIIVALDKNNNVVSTSKLIHVATKGGKVGNHKSVTVKKTVITKAKKLKKGKPLKLDAKAVKASKLKVNKHVAVRYESSNTKIATVSSKGVVKGKKKGTCYIYAYAQNGVYKRIKVIVK